MRCWIICFFSNLIVCLSVRGQQTLPAGNPLRLTSPSQTSQNLFSAADSLRIKTSFRPSFSMPVKTIPASYYKNSIGFFCKRELEFEKATKVPLKIRLGSVAYTDKMEGKGTGGVAIGKFK